jgi:hypothetical protein
MGPLSFVFNNLQTQSARPSRYVLCFLRGQLEKRLGFRNIAGVLDHCRLFAFSFVGAIALKTLGLYFAMRKNMQKFACVKFDTEFSLRRKPKERGTYPVTRLSCFQ